MLGSNNYLGLTGDERVKQGALDALDRYGTGLTGSRFLNGTIDLHLELERELADWFGTEAALVFTTGHQANLGALGTILGPATRWSSTRATTPRSSTAASSPGPSCAPFRHNRLDLLEKTLEKAAADGGGILVVVDGVFSMEGDVAPLPEIAELSHRYGARLMVDEAHAARRARRPWRGGFGAVRGRGPGRSPHGHLFEVARLLRGCDRRTRRRDRVPADLLAAVHVHRLGRAGRRSARRWPPCASAARTRVASCSPRSSTTPRYLHAGLHSSASRWSSRPSSPTGPRSSRRSCRSSSATTGRPCSSGRRSTRRGVYVNVAHPPRRAAGRRAAANERDGHARSRHARPRARALRPSEADVRVRARTAPRSWVRRRRHAPPANVNQPLRRRLVHTRTRRSLTKKTRSERMACTCDVAVIRADGVASPPTETAEQGRSPEE